MSVVGTADADAPPTSENVNPAAPNAGAAALVIRFCLEACFTRGIVAFSIPCKTCIESSRAILRSSIAPCKTDRALHNAASRSSWFMFMNNLTSTK
jgi:hypothetical protein